MQNVNSLRGRCTLHCCVGLLYCTNSHACVTICAVGCRMPIDIRELGIQFGCVRVVDTTRTNLHESVPPSPSHHIALSTTPSPRFRPLLLATCFSSSPLSPCLAPSLCLLPTYLSRGSASPQSPWHISLTVKSISLPGDHCVLLVALCYVLCLEMCFAFCGFSFLCSVFCVVFCCACPRPCRPFPCTPAAASFRSSEQVSEFPKLQKLRASACASRSRWRPRKEASLCALRQSLCEHTDPKLCLVVLKSLRSCSACKDRQLELPLLQERQLGAVSSCAASGIRPVH